MTIQSRYHWYYRIGGCALLFLLPSALVQMAGPNFVYVRDGLIALLAVLGLGLLFERRRANKIFFAALAIFSGYVVAYLLGGNNVMQIAVPTKWLAIWIVSYITGLCVAVRNCRKDVVTVVVVLLMLLSANAFVGLYERYSGAYVFSGSIIERAETAMGRELFRLHQIVNEIRTKGLNRESAEYSNLLNIGAILAFSLCFLKGVQWKFVLSFVGVLLFVASLVSGTRSQLIGATYAVSFGTFYLLLWKNKVLHSGRVTRMLLFCAIIIGNIALEPIATFFSSVVFRGSVYGDLVSTNLRLDWWEWLVNSEYLNGGGIFTGSIISASFAGDQSVVLICDNQYLWSLYHLGAPITVLILLLFVFVVGRSWEPPYEFLYIVLLACVLGEGIGKDVFVYPSTILFFMYVGFVSNLERQRQRVFL